MLDDIATSHRDRPDDYSVSALGRAGATEVKARRAEWLKDALAQHIDAAGNLIHTTEVTDIAQGPLGDPPCLVERRSTVWDGSAPPAATRLRP